jgi:hypothetical protein
MVKAQPYVFRAAQSHLMLLIRPPSAVVDDRADFPENRTGFLHGPCNPAV